MIINIIDPSALSILKTIKTDGVPRSLDFSKFLLIGQRNGSIVEYDINKEVRETIMHSHHDGELWGLAILEEQKLFATSCDDNKIMLFDFEKRKCIQRGVVKKPSDEEDSKTIQSAKSARRGGASTTSIEPPERQSRALAWNKKYSHLAVANNIGHVTVREVALVKDNANKLVSPDLDKIIWAITDPKEWVECMQYNPSNTQFAVGSHDNMIYIYNCPDYTRTAVLKGHSSFITGFDWSWDG